MAAEHTFIVSNVFVSFLFHTARPLKTFQSTRTLNTILTDNFCRHSILDDNCFDSDKQFFSPRQVIIRRHATFPSLLLN